MALDEMGRWWPSLLEDLRSCAQFIAASASYDAEAKGPMWFDRFRRPPLVSESVARAESHQRKAVRYHLDVPVSFVAEDRVYTGRCVNVSATGLLARFDSPPELWIDGRVRLEAGEHLLDLNIRVARRQDDEIGFAFLIENDNDRSAIRILIDSVLDRPVLHAAGASDE